MNKADYISLVNTKLPNGANIPSVDHRATMHTDANSIAELVYNDFVDDDETAQTYTTSSALFDYKIKIWKVGSNVYITGVFTANTSLVAGSVIFDVTDTDYLSLTIGVFTDIAFNQTDIMPILMINSQLKTHRSISNGESFDFAINYKSLN